MEIWERAIKEEEKTTTHESGNSVIQLDSHITVKYTIRRERN